MLPQIDVVTEAVRGDVHSGRRHEHASEHVSEHASEHVRR